MHIRADEGSSLRSIQTRHQQLVVVRVGVPNRGGHGKRERRGIKGATGRRAPHAPATALEAVTRDRLGAVLGAPRVAAEDLACGLRLKLDVLRRATGPIASPAPRPRFVVFEAVALGLLERGLLDQDPPALVSSPRAAEAHHDCGQAAGFLRPAGERGVPGRQEHKLVQVRAAQAERSHVLHLQELAAAAASRAGPIPEWRDDHQVGLLALLLKGHRPGLSNRSRAAA